MTEFGREDTVRFIRASSATWLSLNPVLKEGEPGYEKDTNRYKLGNGHSRWVDLEYFLPADEVRAAIQEAIAALPSGGGGGVDLQALTAHISSSTPHPAYDDGASFLLAYQNAKV